jgi:hypothetical protein
MKEKLLISLMVGLMVLNCAAQVNGKWDKLSWLAGEWKGDGSGEPGNGSGTFSFTFDLEKNIMVRKSHSEYASDGTKTLTVHEDLMIIYSIPGGNQLKAIYFDNEGHIINYLVSANDKKVTFISEKQENIPEFRLSYTLLDPDVVNVKFEMAPDGVNFRTYIEGNSRKIIHQ